MKKGYIVLENGMIFEGKRFGYEADVTGELVFSTSAVGYIEALTDPCYQGQILLQTFPLLFRQMLPHDVAHERTSAYPYF